MQWLPRVRVWLVRHPLVYWAVVVAAATVVVVGVSGAIAGIDRRRTAWGHTVRVWVVTGDTPSGGTVDAEPRDYPVAMVPAAALTSAPRGALARHPLARGEVLVTGDIAAGGLAALVPDGWVALSVPADHAGHVTAGAHVELFASGQLLAAGRVIATGDTSVVVAVESADAPGVAQAIGDGQVLIGLDAGDG